MGAAVNHGVKIRFNTEEFHRLIGRTSRKSANMKQFHEQLSEEYGIDLAYSSFMNVINNQRLSIDSLLLWAIAQKLNISMESLIDIEWISNEGSS